MISRIGDWANHISPIGPIRGRLYRVILECNRLPRARFEDEDDDEYEAIRRSVNQERTKIQPGGPFFVPLDGSTQKGFEHFFFQSSDQRKSIH